MASAPYKETAITDDELVWSESDGFGGLLGIDFNAADSSDRSGLRALINSALVAHPRMPMLDVVFDRTARRMATSLRQLTDENVDASLENVTSMRFSDFSQQLGPDSIIAVISGDGLDGNALIAADARLAFAVVDLLLGGRRSPALSDHDGRRLTPIELALSQRLFAQLASDFAAAFSLIAPARLTLDRVETTARFAAIAQDQSVCAVARYRIRIEEFSANAAILIPYAALETVRARLKRDFIDDSARSDEIWRSALAHELSDVSVELRAVIAECDLTVGDLRALAPGATVSLCAGARANVELRAGHAPIAVGRAGRSGDRLALRIERAIATIDSGGAP
jgi:flagellar motor switch protein FliM